MTQYVVQKGDTLSGIAKSFSIPLHELADINDIVDIERLSIGLVLTIPPRSKPEWPKETTPTLRQFYGNPVGYTGGASPTWEKQNIRRLPTPYPMYYPRVLPGGKIVKRPPPPLPGLSIHRKCYDSLGYCLERIKQQFTAEQIQLYELDIYGGAYNFRRIRGSSRLSTHAYGCAIDISHLINRFGRPYNAKAGMIPMEAVSIFVQQGWTWGGTWRRPDAMHFQATD